MRKRTHAAVLTGAAATAVFFAGCSADDFENEPRPAAPIEITAKVDDKKVKVSPTEITGYACDGNPKDRSCGAGVTNVTIANISDETVALTFDGPTTSTASPIAPGSVGEFKIDLAEGDYEVSAGLESNAKPQQISVGPPRESAQNELLLP